MHTSITGNQESKNMASGCFGGQRGAGDWSHGGRTGTSRRPVTRSGHSHRLSFISCARLPRPSAKRPQVDHRCFRLSRPILSHSLAFRALGMTWHVAWAPASSMPPPPPSSPRQAPPPTRAAQFAGERCCHRLLLLVVPKTAANAISWLYQRPPPLRSPAGDRHGLCYIVQAPCRIGTW